MQNVVLKTSLRAESDHYVLINDSLLLQVISPDIDIFEMYSDFSGEPLDLAEFMIPGLAEQNIPFCTIYGIPKPKWAAFESYMEKLSVSRNGKRYGPFFLDAKIKDIATKGQKYPVHELVPIKMISVINLTDLKILQPNTYTQEKPDVEIKFGWAPYTNKKAARRPFSKTLRFEIYQRDEFRCQYCQRHKDELPSGVHLTLDHKIPYSDGGDDSFNNLITACSECNGGKSNKIVKGI